MSKMNSTQQLLRHTIIPTAKDEYSTVIDESSFFEFYCAQQYLKEYELSSEEIEWGIVGGGEDGGCDGIYMFLNDTLVTSSSVFDEMSKARSFCLDLFIFQAKNSLGFQETPILKFKTLVENILKLDARFEKYKGRYSEELCNKVKLFLEIYRKLVTRNTKLKIHFVYASLGIAPSRDVKAQADELVEKCRNQFPIAQASVEFVGANKLFELSRESPNPYRNLQLLAQPIGTYKEKGYVALVKLVDYYHFLSDGDKIVNSLLDANVRDYQGLTAVNKAILETLENNPQEEFWWLNNGVTILASDMNLVSQVEFRLENPKVVNGLQTSREIFDYFSKFPDKLNTELRSLLVRVISTNDEEFRDKIILATNSQTTIPPASLRATDPIHLKIELYCKKNGIYYDRRKNHYRNQGVRIRDIVSIGFMGQCLISLLMMRPDSARARPSTVLSDDISYQKLFNEEYPLEMYYRVARAGKKISECLWKCDKLTRPQRTNVFYYVIYAVCARIVGKDMLGVPDLATLEMEQITPDLVDETIDCVLALFLREGGSDQLAKGGSFLPKLQNELIAKKWVTPLDQRKLRTENVAGKVVMESPVASLSHDTGEESKP